MLVDDDDDDGWFSLVLPQSSLLKKVAFCFITENCVEGWVGGVVEGFRDFGEG